MSLIREPGSEIIAQFDVPVKGTWKNTAAHLLPVDAVHDSLNIFIREGKLRNRPAFVLLDTGAFTGTTTTAQRHIIGGAMGVTPTTKYVFAVSPGRLFTYNDVTDVWTTYANPVGQVFADTVLDTVDVAFIETSSTYAALFANTNYPIKVWTPASTDVGNVVGTNIPSAKSICIAASRVIALVAPHTVVWSTTLDYTNFSALAVAKRAQTTDSGVCVRTLSALSFVLYKEYSIHLARAQAGVSEATAFSFSEPIVAEGPAGVYAVTDVEGSHIYMTRSGRIGIFDGTSHPRWIADGIWFFLQEDIDQAYAYLIRAVYDYRLNIVIFYYPKVGLQPNLNGLVIVNLPFSGFENQIGLQPHAFLGDTSLNITHGLTKRFDNQIDSSFLFQNPLNTEESQTYILDENGTLDVSNPYICYFQTGLQSMPDAKHTQLTIETFVERAAGNGYLPVIPVVSDALETASGTALDENAQYINLEKTPINDYKGFNKIVRFFGLKYRWTSLNKVRYSGTVVYTSAIGRRK